MPVRNTAVECWFGIRADTAYGYRYWIRHTECKCGILIQIRHTDTDADTDPFAASVLCISTPCQYSVCSIPYMHPNAVALLRISAMCQYSALSLRNPYSVSVCRFSIPYYASVLCIGIPYATLHISMPCHDSASLTPVSIQSQHSVCFQISESALQTPTVVWLHHIASNIRISSRWPSIKSEKNEML